MCIQTFHLIQCREANVATELLIKVRCYTRERGLIQKCDKMESIELFIHLAKTFDDLWLMIKGSF